MGASAAEAGDAVSDVSDCIHWPLYVQAARHLQRVENRVFILANPAVSSAARRTFGSDERSGNFS